MGVHVTAQNMLRFESQKDMEKEPSRRQSIKRGEDKSSRNGIQG